MGKNIKKETVKKKTLGKHLFCIFLSLILVLLLLIALKYLLGNNNLFKKDTPKLETKTDISRGLNLSLSYLKSMNFDNANFGIFKELIEDNTPGFIATNQVIGLFPFKNTFYLSKRNKQDIANYLNQFQDPVSGLYKAGKKIENKQSFSHYDEVDSDFFFTALATYTLNQLSETPQYPLNFLKKYDTPDKMINWIETHEHPWSRNWSVEFFSIALPMILVGSPNSDFKKDKWVKEVFDYLDANRDENTGFWRKPTLHFTNKNRELQDRLAVASHLWPCYNLANHTPVMAYPDKIIGNVLALQGADGHFMGGISVQDLDSALALSNSYFLTDYRKGEIEQSLTNLSKAILRSQNKDGGFGFLKDSSSSVSDTVIRLNTLSLIFQINKSSDIDYEFKIPSLFFPYNS